MRWVKFECFSHNGAIKILEMKGLLGEVSEVMGEVTAPLGTTAVRVISGLLARKGWALDVNLLEETDYRHDAFKEGVLVEIDLRGSLIDSVHRNFLRAQELYIRKKIEVLVQIVEVDREPKFGKVRRDITIFKSVLSIPIYLIGLHET